MVTQASDGSVTSIGGLLRNNAQHDYKNVQIEVTGIDINGNVISSKKTIIATIKANDDASYDVSLPYNPKIEAGDVKVLNATAV